MKLSTKEKLRDEEATSSRWSVRAWFSHIMTKVPVTTLYDMYHLAWPIYISLALQYGLNIITLALAGHTGPDELGAVGLATSTITITGLGIATGLGTGYETLAAQALGAGNYERVGILLQTFLILSGFTCCVICAIWVNIDGFLVLLNQPVAVAKGAHLYLVLFIPGMLSMFFYRALRSYMTVQRYVVPQLVACFLGVILLIVFDYILLFVCDLGLAGLSLANAGAMCSIPITLLTYIIFFKLYEKTFPSFSLQSFLDWDAFLSLAIPGAVGSMLKMSIGEVTVILMGQLGEEELGAQVTLFQIMFFIYLIPASLGIAVSVIIAYNLGNGRPRDARVAAQISIALTGSIAASLVLILNILRNVIGTMFSEEPTILQLISENIPLMSLTFFFESLNIVYWGVFAACAMQKEAALIMFACCYLIGLPLGGSLAIVNQNMSYMWGGWSLGVFIQTVVSTVVMFVCLNFDELSEQAKIRSAVKDNGTSYGSMDDKNAVEDIQLLNKYNNSSDGKKVLHPHQEMVKLHDRKISNALANCGGKAEIKQIKLYTLNNSNDQNKTSSNKCLDRDENKTSKVNNKTSLLQLEEQRGKILSPANEGKESKDVKNNLTTSEETVLSKRIVLKRCLTLLLVIIILTVGIIVRFTYNI